MPIQETYEPNVDVYLKSEIVRAGTDWADAGECGSTHHTHWYSQAQAGRICIVWGPSPGTDWSDAGMYGYTHHRDHRIGTQAQARRIVQWGGGSAGTDWCDAGESSLESSVFVFSFFIKHLRFIPGSRVRLFRGEKRLSWYSPPPQCPAISCHLKSYQQIESAKHTRAPATTKILMQNYQPESRHTCFYSPYSLFLSNFGLDAQVGIPGKNIM